MICFVAKRQYFFQDIRLKLTQLICTDLYRLLYLGIKCGQRSRSMPSKTCTTPMKQQLENVSTKFVMHNIPSCKTLDRSNFPNYQIAVSMTTIVDLDFASIVLCSTYFIVTCEIEDLQVYWLL